jgi:hypothetical protein
MVNGDRLPATGNNRLEVDCWGDLLDRPIYLQLDNSRETWNRGDLKKQVVG